ncbi:MAG: DNA-directed RNA polymerase subunit B [Candidatus Aenigmarchaeota archaeon ex4484_56]|nr:MAG: DNA-directed RNA polymerase subunit B [Candidatus Aenigmarchaeota archaeon ex4484_56]
MTKIFLDGYIIGETNKPKNFVKLLREKRRKGEISSEVNIAYLEDIDEIRINTSENRLRRPLIIVKNGQPLLTEKYIKQILDGKIGLNELVSEGVVEYLNAEEEENAYIANTLSELTEEHTHLELNPSVILGISASLVPFTSHNRSDRVNYGAKMMGQSLGIYAVNYLRRPDTKSYVLLYPQHPIVDTAVYRTNILNEHPQGQNVIIAIMPYKGYNMEDAIIVNKSSIERGLFRSIFFRTYQTEEKKYWGIESDEIGIPDENVKNYRSKEEYDLLDIDGIAPPESNVKGGDVIIGKISPLRFYGPMESFMLESENRRDTSITIKFGERGIVDRVIITQTDSGDKLIKSTVRETRIPEVGDKFASRYGQKGVIGAIVPTEDMPLTKDGITPDIIINPLAIPSRMTIGQLLEIVYGKAAALSMNILDGTSFNEEPEEEITKILEQHGFEDYGVEEMYNGETGEKIKSKILIGPCYYQRLYHMVRDKYFMRARGPITIITRQPTEGRAREGGLRFGEMEKDCLLAHGAALTLKERFSSDETKIPICTKCGVVAIENRVKGIVYCPLCKKANIIRVKMSYAFKLLLDEMLAMGIYPKIHLKEEI